MAVLESRDAAADIVRETFREPREAWKLENHSMAANRQTVVDAYSWLCNINKNNALADHLIQSSKPVLGSFLTV